MVPDNKLARGIVGFGGSIQKRHRVWERGVWGVKLLISWDLLGQSSPNTKKLLNFFFQFFFLTTLFLSTKLYYLTFLESPGTNAKKKSIKIRATFFFCSDFNEFFFTLRFRTLRVFWDQKINLATFEGKGGWSVCR